MPRYTRLEHLRFLLREVHPIAEILKLNKFNHLDWEQAWMMVETAKQFADRDMFPFFKSMDEQPAHYAGEGIVKTHAQLKTIIKQGAQQGWISGSAQLEHGGMQLPMMLFNAGHYIFAAANNGATGYLSLTAGAAALINSFGSKEQHNRFVPKMYAGEGQGTMALTETQAGSSLSDITTTAAPLGDNLYSIKGQKIFISGGQHEACENFIHLTLARIEGAPAGTKGISLFIIPKFWPADDGELSYNDVFCAGDFKKLGQKTYATTHLVFGDNNNCKGWLVGEPHKGLTYMFQMMNEARIGVGMGAVSIAQAAYYAALEYANERTQGRLPSEKDPLKPPTPIINHADVQRMLLTQKAIVEGGLALSMECNRLFDLAHATSGETQQESWLLLELLTPMVKAWCSEQANRSAALAIQVFGGYGYTMDFPVQQYYRDLKIYTLYEGTTGIQALDLLGRKVSMEKGKALNLLIKEMNRTAEQAKISEPLKPYAAALETEVGRIAKVLNHLRQYAEAGDVDRYLSDATVFMEMMGHIVVAWQWLKQGHAAQEKIQAGDFSLQTPEFYEGILHTMKFFYRYELPYAEAYAKTLMDVEYLTNLKNKELLS